MNLELSNLLLGNLLILMLVFGSLVGASLYQFLGIRFHRPHFDLRDRNELPSYLQKLYQDPTAQLCAQGFEVHHSQLSRDLIAHEHADKWSLVLVNPETQVYAEISPATTFLDMPGYEVDFWSFTDDNTALLTLSGRGHTILCDIPGVEIHDPLVRSLADQYQAHKDRRQNWLKAKSTCLHDPKGFVRQRQQLMDAYFLNLIQCRYLVSTGNNEFRLTIGKSIEVRKRIRQGEKRVRNMVRVKPKTKINQDMIISESKALAIRDLPVEAEVQSFIRLTSAREKASIGLVGKLALFIVTLLASYLAFGLVFSFHSVIILLSVILIHELGHLVAMFIFRYSDKQVLFIPLLGAATFGKKQSVANWKQAVVYLMGPLPGIVLGICLLILYQKHQVPWLFETAIILLAVNYLNLLPFLPLDGGHIVRLTIMEKYPTGKLTFTAVSGIAFTLSATILNEPIFWVLAGIMLLSIPFCFLETSVRSEIKKRCNDLYLLDFNGRLSRVFETLKLPKFNNLHFSQKFNLVRALNDITTPVQQGGQFSTVGLMGLYVGALLLTPPAFLVSTMSPEKLIDTATVFYTDITKPRSPDVSLIVTKSTKPTKIDVEDPWEKFESALDSISVNIESGNINSARKLLDQAANISLVTNNDNLLVKFYRAEAAYHTHIKNFQVSENYLQKSIDLYLHLPEKPYDLLATSYQHFARIKFLQKDLDKHENYLKKAFKYSLSIQESRNQVITTNILSCLLDLFYAQKRFRDAQATLQRILPKLVAEKDTENSYVTRYVHQELGWMYGNKGFVRTAIQHFNSAIKLAGNNTDTSGADSSDPLEQANIYLAMASIHYKKGNHTAVKKFLERAKPLVIENNYDSLDEYILSYSSKINVDIKDKIDSRKHKRWQLIKKTYHSSNPQALAYKQQIDY